MALIDSSQLPNLDLLGVFMYHYVLITWALIGTWCPNTYSFYNFFFLAILLWCLKELTNEIPLVLAIRVNAVGIILDFAVLVVYSSYHWWANLISVAAAVVNLLFRFITIPILSKYCSDRTGGTNDGLPSCLVPIFGNNDFVRNDPYENMDVPHQSYPRTDAVVVTGTHSYTPKNPPPYQG